MNKKFHRVNFQDILKIKRPDRKKKLREKLGKRRHIDLVILLSNARLQQVQLVSSSSIWKTNFNGTKVVFVCHNETILPSVPTKLFAFKRYCLCVVRMNMVPGFEISLRYLERKSYCVELKSHCIRTTFVMQLRGNEKSLYFERNIVVGTKHTICVGTKCRYAGAKCQIVRNKYIYESMSSPVQGSLLMILRSFEIKH